jgi:hypothetical protein
VIAEVFDVLWISCGDEDFVYEAQASISVPSAPTSIAI